MVEVRTAKQLDDLKELLTSGGDVSIAVAYVRQSALTKIEPELRQASSEGKVRFLIALDGRITEPAAAERLLDLSSDSFEVRYFDLPASERAIFHPKLYICSSAESVSFLTGSYNLTGAALGRNREHGLRVTCTAGGEPAKEALDSFDALWKDDHAKPLTQEAVRTYREDYIRSTIVPEDELWADQGYWLFKCNPPRHDYSFTDFVNDEITDWGGQVENPASRQRLRDEVRIGDMALFYHTGHTIQNLPQKAVLGTAQVVWHNNDPNAPLVHIRHENTFLEPVTLGDIVAGGQGGILQNLGQMMSKTHTRHTVQRVRPEEYQEIVRLGMTEQAQ